MIDRRLLMGFALAGLAGSARSQGADKLAPATSGVSRRDEVSAFKLFAETTHPRGAEAARDQAWNSHLRLLADRADQLGEVAYITELVRATSWFADGHTMVETFRYSRPPFAYRYPFRIETYHDGVFVADAWDEARPLKDCRIERLADRPIAEVVRLFADLWKTDSDAYSYRMIQVLFYSPGLFHGLGVLSGSHVNPLPVEASDEAGRRVSVRVTPRTQSSSQDNARVAPPPPTNLVRAYPEKRAFYIRLDAMADLPDRTFDSIYGDVLAATQDPDVRRLVIDLRRNSGGNNDLPEPLRKTIARSRFNAPGGVYVLISPFTFSAGQNLATRLERETYALFVGEPTGGAPNHFGDAETFTGAATGVRVRVSRLPWSDSSPFDKRRSIHPDIFLPERYADRATGRDPALEAALSHVDDRAVDDRSLTHRWARPSQKARWKPFWLT